MILCIQHVVGDILAFEHAGNNFGVFHGDRTQQDGLTSAVCLFRFGDNGVELFAFRLEHTVVLVHAAAGAVGGDNHHIQFVDLVEFSGFRFCRTGHASQFLIHTEIVLDSDRGEGLRFFFDADIFLGFQCLMETIAETAAGKDTPGVFVNDQHFVVLHHVMHIFFKEAVGAEELGKVLEALALEGECFL